MQSFQRPRPKFLGLVAIFLVATSFLLALGALDFVDPDESRHAEIAREMRTSGDYLTPTLHGTPYYDKPALFHWAINLSSAVVGPGPLATRLPSALSAIFTVLAMALWASRVYSPLVGSLTAIGMATTVGFVAIGRFAVVDALFTALLTAAFLKLGSWFLDSTYSKRSLTPFWVMLGLAVLAKGPVVFVLAALTIALLSIAERNFSVLQTLREARPLRGLCISIAVASPWYVAAWLADPQYIETFLWHHNVERYLGGSDFRHHAPFYYYAIALPLGLLPWSPLIASAAISRLGTSTRARSDLFLGAWILAVLGFYQGSGTKLLTYLLPAFPPLICLGAAFVADCLEGRRTLPMWFRWTTTLTNLLIAAIVTALPFAALSWIGKTSAELCIGLALGPALAVAAIAAARRPGDRSILAMTTVTVAAFFFMVYGPVARQIRPVLSLSQGAALVSERFSTNADAELISLLVAPHAMSFYSGHSAVRYNDTDAAVERFASNSDNVLMTKAKYLERLGWDPLPTGVALLWKGGHHRVVLANDGFTAVGKKLEAPEDASASGEEAHDD